MFLLRAHSFNNDNKNKKNWLYKRKNMHAYSVMQKLKAINWNRICI